MISSAERRSGATDEGADVKEARLRDAVRAYGRCIVAFSGGVDSAVVAAIAAQELGAGALAVTGVSPSLPERERRAAVAFAAAVGIEHELFDTHELEDERYASNPSNRCYYCKTELYGSLVPFARERGFAIVADGLNLDDLGEIRPGRRAAEERGVRSPLADAGFTKDDVRRLARARGLDVWDKPAAACLASRFPTGTAITPDLLARVERAEDALHAVGLVDCRVRHHGDLARVELAPTSIPTAIANRTFLVGAIREAGYRHVTLDLAGYVRGGVVDLIASR